MEVGRAVLRRFGFLSRHAEKETALVLPSRGCRDENVPRKILLRAFVGSVGFLWRNIERLLFRFLERVVEIGWSSFRSTRLHRRDRLFPRAEGDLSSRHLSLAFRAKLPVSRPASIVQLLDHGLQYFRHLLVAGPGLLRLLLLQHVGQGGLQLGEAGRHGAHVALLRSLLLVEDLEQGGVIRVEEGLDPGLGAGRRRAARFPVVQSLLHVVARVLGEFLVEEVVRLLQHLARQRLLGDGSDESGGRQLGRLHGVRRLAESIGLRFPLLARPADRIW